MQRKGSPVFTTIFAAVCLVVVSMLSCHASKERLRQQEQSPPVPLGLTPSKDVAKSPQDPYDDERKAMTIRP